MSADLLRRAAAELREHANAAAPGPWFYNSYAGIFSRPKLNPYEEWDSGDHNLERYAPCEVCSGSCALHPEDYRRDPVVAHVRPFAGDSATGEQMHTAQYIELMHPPVALALAAWLDLYAGLAAAGYTVSDESVAVARAILREPGEGETR